MGASDSKTRARLLDVAEDLMLREGYAAVTSRRISAKAGISGPLVHYYFRSMDDLLLEVLRRRADEGLLRFAAAVEHDPSLSSIWEFRDAGHAFNTEFAALGNHHKAIQAELATYAARFRALQVGALKRVLTRLELSSDAYPPEVLGTIISGISLIVDMEQFYGLATEHSQVTAFVEHWIRRIDPPEPTGPPT